MQVVLVVRERYLDAVRESEKDWQINGESLSWNVIGMFSAAINTDIVTSADVVYRNKESFDVA